VPRAYFVPCIHTAIDMQGTVPSQAALQGSSQGQHPAALSRLAHASGPANVATASNPSVPVQPASILTIDPAASMVTVPAASMVTEPAPMPTVGGAPVVDSGPALPGADLAGHGAAQPACLVAGSANEEEAKEATGLTPMVDQMVKCTVRQGRSLCTEARLNGFVDEVCPQACTTLVRLTHTVFVKLVFATVHLIVIPLMHL